MSSPAELHSPSLGRSKRKTEEQYNDVPPITSPGSRRGVTISASRSKQKTLTMTPFVSCCDSLYDQLKEQIDVNLLGSDFEKHEYRRLLEEATAAFHAPVGNVHVSGSNEGLQLGYGFSSKKKPKALDRLKNLDIVQVAAGNLHTLARSRLGEVYSWGCSDHGEIGRLQPHGMDDEVYEGFPALVTGLIPSTAGPKAQFVQHDSSIIDMAAGGSQSLYLTIDGIVYMNGCYVTDGENYRDMPPPDKPDNDPPMRDELSTNKPAPQGYRTVPRQVIMPGLVKKVVCGRGMNAAIMESEELLTWGYDLAGELGRGITTEDRNNILQRVDRPDGNGYDKVVNKAVLVDRFLTPKPPIWPTAQKMTCLSVACGEYHLVCAARVFGTYDSAAYTTGANGHGQLGHGNYEFLNTLKRIEESVGKNIVQVAAGEYHCLFLDITGRLLWSCGRSDSGQLGVTDTAPLPDSSMASLQPVYFSGPIKRITKITAGGNSNMAVTYDGKVYAWGFAQEGALGLGYDGESYDTECRPRPLDTIQGACLDVVLGSQHSVFLIEPNE